MDQMMEIRRVVNGFIVSTPNEEDDGFTQYVFEMAEYPENVNRPEDGEDLDTWKNLFYFIMNHFGYYRSKHDDKVLELNITNLNHSAEAPVDID